MNCHYEGNSEGGLAHEAYDYSLEVVGVDNVCELALARSSFGSTSKFKDIEAEGLVPNGGDVGPQPGSLSSPPPQADNTRQIII